MNGTAQHGNISRDFRPNLAAGQARPNHLGSHTRYSKADDSQPNLEENRRLRPEGYTIGRKEKTLRPPAIHSNSHPSSKGRPFGHFDHPASSKGAQRRPLPSWSQDALATQQQFDHEQSGPKIQKLTGVDSCETAYSGAHDGRPKHAHAAPAPLPQASSQASSTAPLPAWRARPAVMQPRNRVIQPQSRTSGPEAVRLPQKGRPEADSPPPVSQDRLSTLFKPESPEDTKSPVRRANVTLAEVNGNHVAPSTDRSSVKIKSNVTVIDLDPTDDENEEPTPPQRQSQSASSGTSTRLADRAGNNVPAATPKAVVPKQIATVPSQAQPPLLRPTQAAAASVASNVARTTARQPTRKTTAAAPVADLVVTAGPSSRAVAEAYALIRKRDEQPQAVPQPRPPATLDEQVVSRHTTRLVKSYLAPPATRGGAGADAQRAARRRFEHTAACSVETEFNKPVMAVKAVYHGSSAEVTFELGDLEPSEDAIVLPEELRKPPVGVPDAAEQQRESFFFKQIIKASQAGKTTQGKRYSYVFLIMRYEAGDSMQQSSTSREEPTRAGRSSPSIQRQPVEVRTAPAGRSVTQGESPRHSMQSAPTSSAAPVAVSMSRIPSSEVKPNVESLRSVESQPASRTSSRSSVQTPAAPVRVKRELSSPIQVVVPVRATAPRISRRKASPAPAVLFPNNILPGYTDMPHTKHHVGIFLQHFFNTFQQNRGSIINFYHSKAALSLIDCTIDGPRTNLGPGLRPRRAEVHVTAPSIRARLTNLPACEIPYDSDKFAWDAYRTSAERGPMAFTAMQVVVHGEYVEFATKEKRSFDRILNIASIDTVTSVAAQAGLPLHILSDQYIIRPWIDITRCLPGSLVVLQPGQTQRRVKTQKAPDGPRPIADVSAVHKPKRQRADDSRPDRAVDDVVSVASSRSDAHRKRARTASQATEAAPATQDNEVQRELAALRAEMALIKQGQASSTASAARFDDMQVDGLPPGQPKFKAKNAKIAEAAESPAPLMKADQGKQTTLEAPALTKAQRKKAKLANTGEGGTAVCRVTQKTATTFAHPMHGKVLGTRANTNRVARQMFEVSSVSGYLAVSSRGELVHWSSTMRAHVQKVTDAIELDHLVVHNAAYCEQQRYGIFGFTTNNAKATGSDWEGPQVTLFDTSAARLSKDGNLIQLRLRTFDQTPHTKAGVTSTIVLPSQEPKYRFATAGNDRCIRIWNVNHAPDSPGSGVQIHALDTEHTNTINAMAFPGNGRLWSVGADKRVCDISKKKNKIVRTWKETVAVNHIYPHGQETAMLCLSQNHSQFRYIDFRKPTPTTAINFGYHLPQEGAMSLFLHGEFNLHNQNQFAFAFGDCVRIWDIRKVTDVVGEIRGGDSGVVQPHFESSALMATLEKKAFSAMTIRSTPI